MSRATLAQLAQYGLPAQALAAIPTPTQQAELDAASDTADSYIRGRGQLPLLMPYPLDLIRWECWIAAFNIMQTRGYNPSSGADRAIAERYKLAIEDLGKVQRQALHPAFVFSTVPSTDPTYGLPQVRSDAPRGWPETDSSGTPTVS